MGIIQIKFFNFLPLGSKKSYRVGSKSTQVKARLASYLLPVKTMLSSGWVGSGPIIQGYGFEWSKASAWKLRFKLFVSIFLSFINFIRSFDTLHVINLYKNEIWELASQKGLLIPFMKINPLPWLYFFSHRLKKKSTRHSQLGWKSSALTLDIIIGIGQDSEKGVVDLALTFFFRLWMNMRNPDFFQLNFSQFILAFAPRPGFSAPLSLHAPLHALALWTDIRLLYV